MSQILNVHTSMIVFDHNDIRLSIFQSADDLRQDLIEFFNENCAEWDGVKVLPGNTALDEARGAISEELGYSVLIEENGVVLCS